MASTWKERLRDLARGGLLGQRALTILVAGGLLAVLVAWQWSSRPEPLPPLTEEELAGYLDVAWDVRTRRRAARLAGWDTAEWARWPSVATALERVGWTMERYFRVEAQVSAARLRLQDPELYAAEFEESAAPETHLAIVRPHLEEVIQAQSNLPEDDEPSEDDGPSEPTPPR